MKLSSNRVSFSPTWLEKVGSPAKAHAHYYDAQCSALAVRITAAGSKSFHAFNRGGTPQFIRIGEIGEISLDDARQQALNILQGLRETGLTPKQQKEVATEKRQQEERLEITLGQALEEYVSARTKPGRKRSIKEVTAKNMLREVGKYFADHLNKPLRTLSYPIINQAHEKIIETHTPSVADRVVCNVATLIRFIEEREETRLFEFNPARKVLKLDGREQVFRETHLPAENFPAFFEGIQSLSKDAHDFLLVSLLTGLRLDSVRTLKWQLINFERKTVVLTVAKGRKDESEFLPISDFVTDLLKRRLQESAGSPFVFPHPEDAKRHLQYHDTFMDKLWEAGGGTLERVKYHVHGRDGKPRFWKSGKPTMDTRLFLSGRSSICNQFGKPLTHHDFRRTFCSVAAGTAGVDVFSAMRLTLHQTGGGASLVHSRYVQLEHLRPALERITTTILELGHYAPPNKLEAANVIRFPTRMKTPPELRHPENAA